MKAPSANRKVLTLLAGIVWSAVGLALMAVAVSWLRTTPINVAIVIAIGVLGGIVIHRYGFAKLVTRNLVRIYEQAPGKDKVCIFAFQNTRSYIMVILMMAMGYTLRHLPMPRVYLAPIYLAIGLAMFLASISYYRHSV